jgi:putative cardiolipin synthase
MRHILSCIVAAAAMLMTGCASLPSLEGRTVSTVLSDTATTRLGHAVAAAVAENPGMTGIHAIPDPHDAIAARAVLALAAEKSIDAQYYIWHSDLVGTLLFDALWQAAERGVRVRLLLDDMNTLGLDRTIAALDAHPNLEVRLYNPFAHRGARGVDFLTDFARVNRRMHNKSFTVDNQVTVVGGRNIGDEYFAAGSGIAFTDLDVLAVGAGVRDVSQQFDLYWNSPSAYPAAGLVGARPSDGDDFRTRVASTRADPESAAYIEAVRATPLIRNIIERRVGFERTIARLVYDDPAKTLDTAQRKDVLLLPELVRTMGRAEKTFDLISPYFVPGDEGTTALVESARKGVKIRILTNSLAALDESTVFAGYGKRRLDLLRAGIRIFEIKPTADQRLKKEEKDDRGSSGSSALHAKTFAVDGSRVFVGSFNMDQRSALLNTEMGFVIESPKLALQMAEVFDSVVPLAAYEVQLAPDGKALEWLERTATGEVRYDTEPETSWFRRFKVNFLSILPIDWLL